MPKAIEQCIIDQQTQIRSLLELFKSSGDMPVVLACDCNVQRTSSSRLLLETVLTNSAVTMGWQMRQAPRDARLEHDVDHIDYIWYGGSIRPVGLYRSNDAGGSDHAPVFADFLIN